MRNNFIKKTFKKIEFKDQYVIVESGVMLSTLVRNVNKRNIKGFESLVRVPGTVGGALIMNAVHLAQKYQICLFLQEQLTAREL